MKKRKILLYFALFMWFVVPVTAQPTIYSHDFEVLEGDIIEVPIYLKGVDSILGFQFALDWDENLLEFIELSEEALDSPIKSSNVTDDNIFRYLWAEELLKGMEIDSVEQLLIKVKFKVIGKVIDTTFINIIDDHPLGSTEFNIKFSHPSKGVFDVDAEKSTIIIKFPVGTEELISGQQLLLQNKPNPFFFFFFIPFNLSKAQVTKLTVFDRNGVLVFSESHYFTSGKNQFILTSDNLMNNGFYFYQISTDSQKETKSLFYIKQ